MRAKAISWLVRNNCIAEEDTELYTYALNGLLFKSVPFVLILIFGIVMGDAVSSVIIVATVLTIRERSGGYHAKSPWTCLIASSLIMASTYLVSTWVSASIQLIALSFISALIVMILSPIDNENKKLTEYEKRVNKHMAVIITVIWLCIEIVMYLAERDVYCVNIAMGIIIIMFMQLACVIRGFINISEK